MSAVSSFLQEAEGNLEQALLAGALSGSTTNAVNIFIENTPAATLPEAEAYIQSQAQQLITDAIHGLPSWEQTVVEIIDQTQTSKINSYINSIVAPAYEKAIGQLEGTTAENVIKASV